MTFIGVCSSSALMNFRNGAGEKLVYFRSDAPPRSLSATLDRGCSPEIERRINVIRHMYNDGEIELVQNRIGHLDVVTEYIAIRRKKRRPVPEMARLKILRVAA